MLPYTLKAWFAYVLARYWEGKETPPRISAFKQRGHASRDYKTRRNTYKQSFVSRIGGIIITRDQSNQRSGSFLYIKRAPLVTVQWEACTYSLTHVYINWSHGLKRTSPVYKRNNWNLIIYNPPHAIQHYRMYYNSVFMVIYIFFQLLYQIKIFKLLFSLLL